MSGGQATSCRFSGTGPGLDSVPVCALDYGPCLAEVVRHGENRLLVRTADELARQLCDIFAPFPDLAGPLSALTHRAAAARPDTWREAWNREVWPVVVC